jgi:RND family efflux transporter MFP subunit
MVQAISLTTRCAVQSAALLLALGATTLHAQDVKKAAPVTVESAIATTRPNLVALAGPVVAHEEMSIGARVPGLALEEVRVQVGDVVARGQVLATLDTALTQAEVLQAQGAVAAAEALAAQGASEAARAEKLAGTGAIAAQTYDQVQAKAAVLRAELVQAQAVLTVAELKVTQARILAPDAGVISARSAIVGSVLSPGQELFRLIRRNQLEWRAEVTEAQATQLAPGQSVRIAAADHSTVHGLIRALAPSFDPVTRLGIAYVTLDPSSVLRAGMYVQGEVQEGAREVLLVPSRSVLIREGHSYVATLEAQDAGHIAKFHQVTIGSRDVAQTEVLSGLTPGSRVIVGGAGFLSDGSPVRDTALPAAK